MKSVTTFICKIRGKNTGRCSINRMRIRSYQGLLIIIVETLGERDFKGLR